MSTVEIEVAPRDGDDCEPQKNRRAQRIRCEEKKVLLRDPLKGPREGKTVDESFGGIGLTFIEAPTVQIGQDVDVLYNGVRMTAVVRHLTVNDDDTFQVGLEWKGASLTQQARDAVNRRRQSLLAGGDQSQEQMAYEKFVRMIPGGVYMMWSLYEASSSYELGEAAQRLRRHAAMIGITTLSSVVNDLQQAIDNEASHEIVGECVHALLEKCIELCESRLPEPVVAV